MLYHVIYHALKTEPAAVFGRVNLGHAVSLELVYLIVNNNAPAASENSGVRAFFFKEIDDVFEKLDMPPLVARYGNALGVLFDSSIDYFGHRAVVPKVNHLNAGILKDSPHYIYGNVVTVEQGRRGHDSYIMRRFIFLCFNAHTSSIA